MKWKLRVAPLLPLTLLSSLPALAGSIEDSLRSVSSSPDFVELKPSPQLAIDLKYASSDNFVGQNLYGTFNRAYLHKITAQMLSQAEKNLAKSHPKLKLIILDALRPRSVQFLLWEKVKGTDQEQYVANPTSGSIHNYGFAIDLSLIDETGKQLDMGTPYDDFSPLSQPQLENRYLQEGKLTQVHLKNRKLLRAVMESAGFTQLPIEWWHFDALSRTQVRSQYKIVE